MGVANRLPTMEAQDAKRTPAAGEKGEINRIDRRSHVFEEADQDTGDLSHRVDTQQAAAKQDSQPRVDDLSKLSRGAAEPVTTASGGSWR